MNIKVWTLVAGRLNYLGSSHQWWHLMVVLSFAWTHHMTILVFLYWNSHPCPAHEPALDLNSDFQTLGLGLTGGTATPFLFLPP